MSSAKNRQRQARERVTKMRAEQRRKERRRNILFGVGLAVLAVLVIGGAALYVSNRGKAQSIAGVQSFSGLARTHVTGNVHYRQNPPVGGPHNSVPLNCGIYTAPVPNVNAVHSLEHGAVWVTYRPSLPAASVTALQSLVRSEPQHQRGHTILSPYPGLPAPVVASAWGKQLRLDSASDPRLPHFISVYAQGPQTPEPGAPCSGGTGTPRP